MTLSNELSLRDAALAIYMNDWGFQAEICLDHDRQEHNFSKPPWVEFKFDVIYQDLLTACCERELPIASACRILGDTIPENLITVTFDDLVNWILKKQYQGERLVSASLAKSCSFSELFQFHVDGTQPNNADNDISLKPTQGLALFYGELEPEEPQSMAAVQRELKLARQEIGSLESALKKSDELFAGKFPKEDSLLKVIEQMRRLHINGTHDKEAQYKTNEELINVLVDENEHSRIYVAERSLQAAFAAAKKLTS
ncbi:hypothetical protein P4S64_19850 [Vibrio sp. M60_M31a]